MRPANNSSGWQPIPTDLGPRGRILNLGQFIRSLVIAAFGAAAVVMIAPAQDSARRPYAPVAGRRTINQGVAGLIRSDKTTNAPIQ